MTIFSKRTHWVGSAVSLGLFLTVSAADLAAELDEAARSAVMLLRASTTIPPNDPSRLLTPALRELRDPALTPLFKQLAQSSHPVLKVHGLLGLAECDPKNQLDLVRIAAIEDPAIQAEMISAAIDSKILTIEQSKQLVTWPGLDLAVKVIVAARLVQEHQLTDIEFLQQALESDNLARRSMASLLLLQLGHDNQLQLLNELNRSTDPQRDHVRRMLMKTAIRYEFHRAAPWAYDICTDTTTNPKLSLAALHTALRFGQRGANNLWKDRFASTQDPAQRIRLAFMAMDTAPWLKQNFFTMLASDNDTLIQRIGQVGAAIASEQQIDLAVVSLIEMQHPIANQWALRYAQKHADDQDARMILLGLIMSFEDYKPQVRTKVLHQIISATRILSKRDAGAAAALLKPILASDKTDTLLTQGILLGLIRSSGDRPSRAIVGRGPFPHPKTNTLAIVLLAKDNQPLTQMQLNELKLLVRGGGDLPDDLRLRAAWGYLKRTNQVQMALAKVLGRQ